MNNKNTTYKDSPLGKIPGDWEVIELGKLVDEKRPVSYGIVQTAEIIEGGIRCIRVTDIIDGKIDTTNLITTSKKISDAYKRTLLKKGDLVMALRGKIGQIALIEDDLVGANLTRGVALIALKDPYNNEFLKHQISSERTIKVFERSLNGSALQELSIGVLRKIPIILPKSLPEQKAIAHILSTMDTAISKNNQLIAKKELQKKWLMQNLLTGKKRLKGFSGDRKEVQLINVFQFLKSYSISREGLSKEQGNHFCIHYGDIHAYYETDFLDFKTQKNIPRIVDKNYKIQQKDYLKEGDIVIADASEDYKGVGEAIVVLNLEDKIAVGGLHTIVLRDFTGKTTIKFRGYLFAGENVRNKLRTKATGTSVYSVTKSTLESLVLILPPIKEQTAIAQVLQAADKEIQLLKTKTEKLREQKKGLMQVLLTGKKRLRI